MTVKLINSSDDLNEMKKTSQSCLVVVDVFTDWCGPCKMIAPKYEKLAQTYSNVKFYKLNGESIFIEEYDEDVPGFPTFLFIRDSTVILSITGANMAEIESNIKSLI